MTTTALITGGAGFLGRRLADALLTRGRLCGPDGRDRELTRLVLLDVEHQERSPDPRVACYSGDVADATVLESLIDTETLSIFHLAAIVSGMAEADFDLGMRVNVDASRLLLDVCRARGHCPRVVFTSSVAVYGSTLPEIVRESLALTPQTGRRRRSSSSSSTIIPAGDSSTAGASVSRRSRSAPGGPMPLPLRSRAASSASR